MKKLLLSTIIAASLLWTSPALAATVTKTIGTGAGRDYSTIQAWEDDLDDGTNAANDPTAYQSGDDAVGEVYNDSVFDESVTINGGGTVGLNSITLTVPAGERHDGTAGTGARIVATAARTLTLFAASTVEWLEYDFGGNSNSKLLIAATSTVRQMLLHDTVGAFGIDLIYIEDPANILNCIVYDADGGGWGGFGIRDAAAAAEAVEILNSTAHNITNGGSAANIKVQDFANRKVQNSIATTVSGGSSYSPSSPSNATMDHNLSSDTSASGTGSLTEKSAADQFVSTTGGSEDLHLKSGADAIDAGTDLGTTPTGVNFDIDNRDRDVQNDTWDMGADEFVEAANNAPTISTVTDTPDPSGTANELTFSVDWNDADTEGIKMYICKAEDGGTSGCGGGGTWCSDSDDFDTTDPITCTYTTQTADIGTNNYYAYVCDDEPSCSAATSGTFTVNSFMRIKGDAQGLRFKGGYTIK